MSNISPLTIFESITPSDTLDLTDRSFRAIYIGGEGNVSITDRKGNTITITGLLPGVWHPVSQIQYIRSTGTTATNILAAK